jgi:hypothetical protein
VLEQADPRRSALEAARETAFDGDAKRAETINDV